MRFKIAALMIAVIIVFSSCSSAPVTREEVEKIVVVNVKAQVVTVKNTGSDDWKNVIVALVDGHENSYEWKAGTLGKGKTAQASFNYFTTKTGSVLTGAMLDGIVTIAVEYNVKNRWREVTQEIGSSVE
jgi:hypothetical protein